MKHTVIAERSLMPPSSHTTIVEVVNQKKRSEKKRRRNPIYMFDATKVERMINSAIPKLKMTLRHPESLVKVDVHKVSASPAGAPCPAHFPRLAGGHVAFPSSAGRFKLLFSSQKLAAQSPAGALRRNLNVNPTACEQHLLFFPRTSFGMCV